MKHVFRHFADQTRARPEALARLEQRLSVEVADPDDVRARLSVVPEAPPDAEARVFARLHSRPHAPAPHPARLVGLGGLLAAAAVLWFVRTPEAPLTATLSAPEWRTSQPTPLVGLAFLGEGTLAGTPSAPDIDWRAGTLRVEVEPNRGVKLDVRTREALVRVVGTGFSVERSALGTIVAVQHGRVSVDCTGGESRMLDAGEQTVCLPTTPAALLGRALALSSAGAGPEEILATVDRGLAGDAQGSVREELEIARMQALASASRWTEAWEQASLTLAAGGGRHEDLLHLRARYGMAAQGCSGAVGDLEALYADKQASVAERVGLSDCVQGADPALSRAALDDALADAVTDADRAAIQSRRGRP